MFEDIKNRIETPCIVVDRIIMERNIRKMQSIADQTGTSLRPHIKTHKIGEYARLQLEYGAKGITCAKVSEAEVMAKAGVDDIFLAYPQVGPYRIERVVSLSKRIKRLIVGVDSIEGAKMLSEQAKSQQCVIEVRLEVDTGAKRTGVQRDIVEIAKRISCLSGLKLTGIYTFKSLVLGGLSTQDREKAGKEEGLLLSEIADNLRKAGVPIQEISAGSTPTGENVAATGLVTEIRPGTYIINDYMLTKERWCNIEDIAARLMVTVVSTPCEWYAVVDAGTKTIPTDIIVDVDPYHYPGYAIVEGRPDLRIRRLYEEHGIVESVSGKTGLHVGDVIPLIPIHICTAINLQNEIIEYDNGSIRTLKVDARGMLK